MKAIGQLLIFLCLVAATSCGGPVDKSPKKGANNTTANNTPTNNATNNTTSTNNNTTFTTGDEPCVSVAPASINYGSVVIGLTAQASVTIENCSATAGLTVSGVTTTEGFAGLLSGATQIPPQTTATVVTEFSPIAVGPASGQISFETTAGTATVNVQGEGLESIGTCPVAVAKSRATAADPFSTTTVAAPTTTVELSAAESTGSSPIIAWEWTLVSKPANSSAQIASPTIETPTLFLDVEGAYQVELAVATVDSPDNCPPARIDITARPVDTDEILVQLVWNTPADADQTDFTGTDLDLHYMHPNGTWNMEPWDCYWLSKTPNWGVDGMPSVDIDDTDGLGPENISHRQAGPLVYRVGVHYFADNGFGASTATTRIYRGGQLITELSQQLVTSDAFWFVGSLNAADDTFMADGTITMGFPPN